MPPSEPRRPDPGRAMAALIAQIRATLPFDIPAAELCRGPCVGCPKKLLEFMELALADWQAELDAGDVPSLGELQRRGRQAKKVARALAANGLALRSGRNAPPATGSADRWRSS